MEMMWAEIATIVTRGDVRNPLLGAAIGDGMHACAHRLGYGFFRETVDHNLQYSFDIKRQRSLHRGLQGRAVCVVGGGDLALILRADLRARAHDAAREWRDHFGDIVDGAHRALTGGEHCSVRFAEHEQIAAAHRLLGEARGRLAHELAIHHRDAPEAPAADSLRHLPAVAEEAERSAEL